MEKLKRGPQPTIIVIIIIVLLLSVTYWLSLSRSQSSKINVIKISELRLSTSLKSGNQIVQQQSAFNLASKAMVQLTTDETLATQNLAGKSVVINNAKALSGKAAMTGLMDQQLKTALSLSQQQINRLTNQINLSRTSAELQLMMRRISYLKASDDERAAESILYSLQPLIRQSIGVNRGIKATDQQADLTTFNSDLTSARSISVSTENYLAAHNPSLSMLRTNELSIITAQRDIKASINAAQAIMAIISQNTNQ